jgi:hypothetical protein
LKKCNRRVLPWIGWTASTTLGELCAQVRRYLFALVVVGSSVVPTWQYTQEYEHAFGEMVLTPRLRPSLRDGTGPKTISSAVIAAASGVATVLERWRPER